MRRRLFRIAILALGGLIGLGITLFLIARHMGAGTIQDWIGSQIQDIANGYLNPKLTFTDLAYQYPLSVSLKNLHLTADDPEHPGHTIDIIACNHAEVALGEIPSVGKPIIIEKIALTEPLISAVAVEPGSKKFVGFANLIRGASDQPVSTSSSSSSAPKKLSDVFRMRLVQIINGKIVYDPRIPGTVPMALDQINTLLNIEPAEEGWYKIDTDIARKPVFDLSVQGQLNLDSFSVKAADIKLLADLGRDKLDYLPPEIQALLKQYEAKGKLKIEIAGNMPILDPMSGQIQAKMTLDSANIAMNGLRIPVDNLSLESRFENHEVYLPLLRVAALGGTTDLSGSVTLNDRLDSQLHLKISDVVPGKLFTKTPAELASASPDQLNLNLNIAASLMSLIGKAPAPPRSPLASIDLTNFRVSAADPDNPKKNLDLVACRKLAVDLRQPIISGKPIIIDSIVLDSPVISAVAVSPGSMQYIGVPSLPAEAPASHQASAAATTELSAPMPKLASTVQVKTFQLNGARVIYDPRLPDTQRMDINHIDASLNIDPDDPGSYKLSTTIDRSPIFNLAVNGEIDIDNPGLQNLVIDLQADLSQDQLDFLPPQLQLIVRHLKAHEKLNLHAATSVAMSDPTKANAQLDLHVQNIDLSQGDFNIPIQDLSMSAHLLNRHVIQTVKITALNNVFDIHSATTLNSRLDTDITLNLNNIVIESLLASLKPHEPPASSSTILNAQVELQSPLMVALGAIPGDADEPAAKVTVRNFKLTTQDPISSQPMDFFACDSIATVLPSLPAPGKPIEVASVEIDHPSIRAVAMAPQSNQFAGFIALQNLAAIQSASATTESTPATLPSVAVSKPKLGDLFRVDTVNVSDASVYYDPRIDTTTPLSLDQIAAKIDLDSLAGNAYRFDTIIPSPPDLNLKLSGRADVDTLTLNNLKLDLTTRIGQNSPDYKYLPPQLQVMMRPYDPVGQFHVTALGTVPLTRPMDSDVTTYLALDNLRLTAGGFRIPVAAVRMPIRYTPGQVQFLDPPMDSVPSIMAFDGIASIGGNVMLNDRLDSTLSVKTDGILLQSIMAAKIAGPKTELIGAVKMDLELVDAPILQIAADAATPPPTPPPPAPEAQSSAQSSTPRYMSDLPQSWGSATIEVTHARLAGLEVIQGISNLAKSAFSSIINARDKDEKHAVAPKENAKVVCDFQGDHVVLTAIHYEGEVVAADGKGYITLQEYMDLYLTGGLLQKLQGLGAVGNWIKQASDSLLYYHVWGTPAKINYEVKRGDGKPIVEGAKKITKTAENGVKTGLQKAGEGLDKAGSFLGGLFNHKKKDQNQDQSQTQPSNSN